MSRRTSGFSSEEASSLKRACRLSRFYPTKRPSQDGMQPKLSHRSSAHPTTFCPPDKGWPQTLIAGSMRAKSLHKYRP